MPRHPTKSEEFAKDYAYLLTVSLFPKDDPIFKSALKQITDSVLGYRNLLLKERGE